MTPVLGNGEIKCCEIMQVLTKHTEQEYVGSLYECVLKIDGIIERQEEKQGDIYQGKSRLQIAVGETEKC